MISEICLKHKIHVLRTAAQIKRGALNRGRSLNWKNTVSIMAGRIGMGKRETRGRIGAEEGERGGRSGRGEEEKAIK